MGGANYKIIHDATVTHMYHDNRKHKYYINLFPQIDKYRDFAYFLTDNPNFVEMYKSLDTHKAYTFELELRNRSYCIKNISKPKEHKIIRFVTEFFNVSKDHNFKKMYYQLVFDGFGKLRIIVDEAQLAGILMNNTYEIYYTLHDCGDFYYVVNIKKLA